MCSGFFDAYAWFKLVSSRCRGPSYFSLRGQRKVTQREATPMARPPGILPCGYAGGLRGFPTAHPCTGGKLARIPASHPADFPPPARRAIGAPGRAARSQRALFRRARAPATGGALLLLLLLARTMRARFSGVPSAAVRRGRSGRAAGVAMEGNAFSRGQEPARKARPRLTDLPSRDGRKAPPRGAVSLWLLSLWASKEKVARAPTGARNRFDARASAEAKAPSPQPTPPTMKPLGERENVESRTRGKGYKPAL